MKTTFSCEFFPPKTEAGFEKLKTISTELAEVKPEFFSVTYGAGGSTRERSFNAVDLVRETGINTAPHISCVSHSKEELSEILNAYQEKGINKLVVLRGDAPSGQVGNAGDFAYASDFVAFIREQYGQQFFIEVAAYPEAHPQSQNLDDDLAHFKTKMNAGADSAITQYFYNPDAYFYFVERCQKLGISQPIVPGIMPILNAKNLLRFSRNCGADIPRWIVKQLESYDEHDKDSVIQFGQEVIERLCDTLIAGGAPSMHLYTMNQSQWCLDLIKKYK